MQKIAIIGSGISALTIAQLLKDKFNVTVLAKDSKPGGLVKCDRVKDNLFHRVGGHVFNSRNKEVIDWFWGQFDLDKEFIKAKRNAKILMKDKIIGYPLENYLSELPNEIVSKILDDMLAIRNSEKAIAQYDNFAEFLMGNFGNTLYELYFKPYNNKIWNADLTQVPLEWLDGKLPMPHLKEMLMSNIVKKEESEMVHATFYYAKENGSQFIADRLSEGLNIVYNSPVNSIELSSNRIILNKSLHFDKVVYTGDVRQLSSMLLTDDSEMMDALENVKTLRSNGTSNIFCETDATDISWLYLPEDNIKAHRIIYTGTFSETNNRGSDRMTCVVEFSGKHDFAYMSEEIKKLPGNLTPLDFNYEPNSYVVQEKDTRKKIAEVRSVLEKGKFFLLGRFAEWEYYNMDKAIEAAFSLKDKINVIEKV